jgi:ankyrin repeat protein
MGAGLNSRNKDGDSPLSIARKLGNKEIIAFLEKNNARIPPPPTGEKPADSPPRGKESKE